MTRCGVANETNVIREQVSSSIRGIERQQVTDSESHLVFDDAQGFSFACADQRRREIEGGRLDAQTGRRRQMGRVLDRIEQILGAVVHVTRLHHSVPRIGIF